MKIFDRHSGKDDNGNNLGQLHSMVDFSTRIPNISQNILLILEVAFYMSEAYEDKKRMNPDY